MYKDIVIDIVITSKYERMSWLLNDNQNHHSFRLRCCSYGLSRHAIVRDEPKNRLRDKGPSLFHGILSRLNLFNRECTMTRGCLIQRISFSVASVFVSTVV